MVFSKMFFAVIMLAAVCFGGGGTIGTDVQTRSLTVQLNNPEANIEIVTATHSSGKVYTLSGCKASKCIYNIEHLVSGSYTAAVDVSTGNSFSGSFSRK